MLAERKLGGGAPEQVIPGDAGVLAMKRMGLMIAVMVVGIAIMLWAGWHNLRERRLAMQQAAANHVTLTPDGKMTKDSDATAPGGDGGAKLVGKAAPAFTLVTLQGKKVSLADYKGRPVLVNFWATWCAPCKLEMPWFETFRKQYQGQGFEILGINEDPDVGKDKIAATAQKTGVSYPILLEDERVSPAYGGIDYLPMSFYVDRNGVIQEETAGLTGKDEVEAHIKKILGTATAQNAGPVAAR